MLYPNLTLGVLDSDVLQFVATHLAEGKYLKYILSCTSFMYSVDLSPRQLAICCSQLMLITDCYIHGFHICHDKYMTMLLVSECAFDLNHNVFVLESCVHRQHYTFH